MERQIEIIRCLEPVPYAAMLETQKQRVKAVQRGEAPNTLYLLEHPPVITMGRNGHLENLLLSPEQLAERGIALEKADRGGDVTYHGPGQMVAYPILNLNEWQRSVGWYLRTLEQVVIALLASYGINGERVPGFTGVWTRHGKICAIGVGVNRWVSFHGIALNVSPQMDHFKTIIPCGIADKPVSSLALELDAVPPMEEVQERYVQAFLAGFQGVRVS